MGTTERRQQCEATNGLDRCEGFVEHEGDHFSILADTWQMAEHSLCEPNIVCPCASEMGDRLLRELLDALGWEVPARPDAPRVVWDEALARVRASGGSNS